VRSWLMQLMMSAFILLHSPDGSELFVNRDEIIVVGSPRLFSAAPEANAAVLVHDTWIVVWETPREVVRRDSEPST
jgi:hypothetical protein